MDHLAEGFRGSALAPAAMPWRRAASRSLPKAAKIISRFHDGPPSKRSHDTISLYQGDVARHRIGIVCISEAGDAVLSGANNVRRHCLPYLAATKVTLLQSDHPHRLITAMTFAAILTGLVAPLADLPLAADVYGAAVIVLALVSLLAMLRSA
jgi:hypothetical protein